MTMETENASPDTQQDQADAEAAFSASFDGKDIPAATKPAEKTEAEKAAEAAQADAAAATPGASKETPEAAAAAADPAQAAAPAAAPATPEAASTPTPSPKVDENAELKASLRRLEGRYGALHDQLTKLTTAKEAEGKPAAATPVELARLKAEYPEIAEVLIEDLAKVLVGQTAKVDPKEVDTLVSQRVALEAAALREAAVTDAHPNWQADLFNKDPATGQKTPTADYLAWRQAIGADEAEAFENSTNPYQVIRKLTGFYEWKNKAAKAEDAKTQRLKAAVAPQGVPRASPPNLSDEEAMRKGFEEGFNS